MATVAQADSAMADLVALQADLPVIPFDKTNPHFRSKFASLGAIMEGLRPLLAKHGFAWVTLPSYFNGQPTLRYMLVHRSGREIAGEMLLFVGDKATAQTQGAAITYARRYALSSVLGVVTDEDDDGNAASHRPTSPSETAPRPGSVVVPTTVGPAAASGGSQAKTPPNLETPFHEVRGLTGRDEKAGAPCPKCKTGTVVRKPKKGGKKGEYAECSSRDFQNPQTCQWIDFDHKWAD